MKKDITFEERQLIEKYLNEGLSIHKIGRLINRSISTVCVEIRKNCEEDGSYISEKAHEKKYKRMQNRNNVPTVYLLNKKLEMMNEHLNIILETLQKIQEKI